MKRAFKVIFLLMGIPLLIFGIAFAVLPLPGDIPVLMYHFVDTAERAANEKNVVSRESFRRQMDFLQRFGFRVITLDEFYETQKGQRQPLGREVVITFDDGNYTFEEQAFEILEEHSFPAAVFVVSESVKHGLHGSMTAETLRRLMGSNLITIGSHSKTHPLLSQIPFDMIKEELEESKSDLEKMLEVPVLDFAYPSGDFDAAVIKAVEDAGYRMAFTTGHKKLKGQGESLYSLARVKITRTSDHPLAFWFKISGIYPSFKRLWHRIRFNEKKES